MPPSPVIRVASFLSSQCPDTGSLYNGSAPFFVIRVAPFLSSQCPDTGIQLLFF
ncbi:hypothetical protein [Wolbachia endosymbiont (group A) of Agelastica alni]|uniref:hypothetical protein n=1 Tax=Wolbachia endosymbiont (group A) of Agelastica alni TaxID=3066130 RepID=UPI003341C249